ncbi:hypothetical protein GDO78_003838 [Eleutherodactylus coqui]|uniref:Uncharacterized protein n=1 Tax=Eleutherodactylus coqui TaxID=57060 RepID=A0A8J6ETH8_ELECQ|nr:hypothetical protein GDO78_003838 [Eleutherodactylus coqui]
MWCWEKKPPINVFNENLYTCLYIYNYIYSLFHQMTDCVEGSCRKGVLLGLVLPLTVLTQYILHRSGQRDYAIRHWHAPKSQTDA